MPPNIVVILADDLGFSDIGCYGSEISTPALDALGRNGLRFTHMYNSARCCPSRAALLTGLHPHQAGVGHMNGRFGDNPAYQGRLNDRCVTIAEALRPAGYRTIMSGKWHVANQFGDGRPASPTPRQRGFDQYFGTLSGAGSYFHMNSLMHDDDVVDDLEPGVHFTDAVSDYAVDRVGAALDDQVPFFLYLAYTAPHWPLHALAEDIAVYDGAYAHGWDVTRTARHERMKAEGIVDDRWPISLRDPDAWSWQDSRYPDWEAYRMAVYAAQVSQMDRGIRQLTDLLRSRGALDDTLIIFMSDNGGCAEFLGEDEFSQMLLKRQTLPDGRKVAIGNRPDVRPGGDDTFQSYDICWANASNAPFRKFKRWVHEGGISTPFVVHWPKRIAHSAVAHTPCHITDIMPTCLDAAGVAYPSEYDGREITPCAGTSLLGVFDDPRRTRPGTIFFEHEGNRAVRDGEWKLVSAHPGSWELYNIEADRTELADLSAGDAARVRQMGLAWGEWADAVGVNRSLLSDFAQFFERDLTSTNPDRHRLHL